VGGATAGVVLPVPGYFRALREIWTPLRRASDLDEVMCGHGAPTGTLHACTQEASRPT